MPTSSSSWSTARSSSRVPTRSFSRPTVRTPASMPPSSQRRSTPKPPAGQDGDMTPNRDRTLTVTWEDPMIGAAQIKDMTGLEYLQAMIAGSIPPPPIVNLMDMTLVAAEVGKVTFTCEPHESQYNPIGTVHGGLVSTLLDSVAGCAVQS